MGVAEATSAPSGSSEGIMGVAQFLGRGRHRRGRGHMTAQWLDQGSHGRCRGHHCAQLLWPMLPARTWAWLVESVAPWPPTVLPK
uniref:Uncharacterized protein n=1 Tax=Ficus carica TaxID=3494 RepID=A0AA88CY87_FICCA|nr:hypothetical protein TIFTF001_042031 [Ficus carica]GMN34406.1 hypothetical protein TIFTF001_042048 [Ficus carica]